MNEERNIYEIKKSIQTLTKFCKSIKECENCMFYFSEELCGIHNPSSWLYRKELEDD